MILDLLKKRYSCREFSEKIITKDILNYMLECARLSSSGGNEQPWKFGVITDRKLIEKISEAASVNYNQAWIAKAPLIIVLCTQLFDTPLGKMDFNRFPSKYCQLEQMDKSLHSIINMEEHQTKIPGEHMVIAALEHGIYSTWISSMDCEKVGDIIGIKGYLVTNIIVFGYPKELKEVTPKKDLKNITFTNHFDNIGV